MSRHPSNRLRAHRKKWELTQRELGLLLGVSDGSVSDYELNRRTVPAAVLIAAELIFGKPIINLFPALVETVEDGLGAHALSLYQKLEGRTDAKSKRKLELISGIPDRLNHPVS